MEESYYTTAFPSSSTSGSGFVVNPLSSHPPQRTPRTSLISNNASIYSSAVFDTASVNEKDPMEGDNDEDGSAAAPEDEDEESSQKVKVYKTEIWKEMFLSSNGRDKAFKLIQYTIKTFLVAHTALKRPIGPWEKDILGRLGKIASHLSLTRKQLLLFNWLYPLSEVTSLSNPVNTSNRFESHKSKPRGFLHTLLHAPPPVLLELVQATADDMYTWSRIGLLGAKLGERAARFSDWCWLLATLVGLVENGVERGIVGGLRAEVEGRMYNLSLANPSATSVVNESKSRGTKHDQKELVKLNTEEWWLEVGRAKLMCDLIFVSYDIFRLRRFKNTVQASAGLLSAILSSAKLYDKHRNSILKSKDKTS